MRRLLSAIPWRVIRKERLYQRSHDRYLLEEVIFPELRSRPDMQQILFVGCDTYTAGYPAAFADRTFITIDKDPAKARYGGERHLVDTVANLRAHVAIATLDAVICNGVIGWGLDRPEEIERAMEQCFACLRPGGIFILGWNDMAPWRPVAPEQIEALGSFSPFVLAPFPSSDYRTLGPLRHVFNFYVRPRIDDGR